MPAHDIQHMWLILSHMVMKQLNAELTNKHFIHLQRTYCIVLDTWDDGQTTEVPALMELIIYHREQTRHNQHVSKLRV